MLPSRFRFAVAFLIPFVALALSAGYWLSQSQSHQKLRETARQDAEYRVEQLSSSVAQQTDTLLQLVDITLQVLGNEYVDENLSGFHRSVAYAQAGFPAIAAMQVSVCLEFCIKAAIGCFSAIRPLWPTCCQSSWCSGRSSAKTAGNAYVLA